MGNVRKLIAALRLEELILFFAVMAVLFLSYCVTGQFHLGQAGRIGNFFALICSFSLLFVGLHDVYFAEKEVTTLSLAGKIVCRSFTVLRDWLPLYFALSLYSCLYGLISLFNPNDQDATLLSIDRFIFGETPAVIMQRWTSGPLTELMSFCYLMMMAFPPALLLCVHWRCSKQTFHRVTVGLMVICLLGYCGYVLVPAIGPLFYIPQQFNEPLSSGLLSKIRSDLDVEARNPRDCFPSMHVAVPFLMLLYGFKFYRPFLILGVPIFVGIFISTMYLRYHYFIDLVAGLLLATFVYLYGGHLEEWWMDEQRKLRES